MTSDQTLSPTTAAQRIRSLDIIRGVSLLGILLMNIVGFGLYHAYMDPTVNGGATGWNLNVWWINSMFFEGTMRGMFSMLFGAGILVFTGRATSDNAGAVSDLFFRRLMWLILFGIIHCYILLWDGEILYAYGIVGMFAFSFRHLDPKRLILFAALFAACATAWDTKDYFQQKHLSAEAERAIAKEAAGDSLDREEKKSLEAWQGIVSEQKPDEEKVREGIAAMHQDYFSILVHKGPENQWMQTTFLYRYNFFDTLLMMLLGMALFKLGVLKAARSTKFYLQMALVGYAIGLAVNYYEARLVTSGGFSILAIGKSFMTYNLGRIPMTMGHVAVIMLFIKSGWLRFLQQALAAVGQMAFTNYITQTLICNFIFLGYGLALYGTLERYELYYIVFGIWILQLIISPIWLAHFRFGPMEWVWRSLTYWQKQPFRRSAGA
jgi:uncharacterized protein